MALDERDFTKTRANDQFNNWKRPECEKRRRIEAARKRFEAATPKRSKPQWQINIPMPETNAGLMVIAAIGGLTIAAGLIWLVKLFT